MRAQFERENIARAYTDFFARTRVDLLITPTLGLEAFPLGKRHPDVVGDMKITPPWLDWAGFLYDANLAGLPAAALPMGFGDDGLPVSIQLLGPRCADARVLAAAEAIEEILGPHPLPPGPFATE